MGETTDYTLIKLDKIEDLVREVKQLLQDGKSQPAVQMVASAISAPVSRIAWLTKALTWSLQTFWKYLPTMGAVLYMKATGQDEKIIAYLNAQLFGI